MGTHRRSVAPGSRPHRPLRTAGHRRELKRVIAVDWNNTPDPFVDIPVPKSLRRQISPILLSRDCHQASLVALGRWWSRKELAMNRKFKVERELSTKLLRDLVITAVETPFGDWFRKVAFFSFAHGEDGSTTKTLVPYKDVAQDDTTFFDQSWSIEMVVENPGEGADFITRAFGWRKLRQALEDPKMQRHVIALLDENYDAITADALFQRAIFGEVVYG